MCKQDLELKELEKDGQKLNLCPICYEWAETEMKRIVVKTKKK